MDGFLHISEMSYARLSRASDFLARGDKIRVKVLKVETVDDKKRISLSMKATEDDPWMTAQEKYKDGENYSGKVMRLESFGAFVELEPGVEGLVHISEMSWVKRIHHPADILKVGDRVSVRILSLDSNLKKISLSLKNIDDDPWLKITENYALGSTHTGKVERLKGFGAIVELEEGLSGLLPLGTLKKAFGESYRRESSPPKEIQVLIRDINLEEKKILLGLPNVEEENSDQEDYKEYLNQQKEKKPKDTSNQRGTFGDILASKLDKLKK